MLNKRNRFVKLQVKIVYSPYFRDQNKNDNTELTRIFNKV